MVRNKPYPFHHFHGFHHLYDFNHSHPFHHIHHVINERSIPIRSTVSLGALLSLSLLGTCVGTLGEVLVLDHLVLPVLLGAHLPIVVALIAVWFIGSAVSRTEVST